MHKSITEKSMSSRWISGRCHTYRQQSTHKQHEQSQMCRWTLNSKPKWPIRVQQYFTLSISWLSLSLNEQRRMFAEFFDERNNNNSTVRSNERAVSAFVLNDDHLQKGKTLVDKRAYGIPFYISDNVAIDAAQAYHGTTVEVRSINHIFMPFWLLSTGTGGTFRADLLQHDRTSRITGDHVTWVNAPRYRFSYPFGEHMLFNQICAAYTEPLSLMEQCLTGTHIPSMLLSRFELLEHTRQMRNQPTLVPFTMSTNTALAVVEKRITRKMILDRVDNELVKFHGKFIRSNVMLESVGMEATRIRPVFLPLIKLTLHIPFHSSRNTLSEEEQANKSELSSQTYGKEQREYEEEEEEEEKESPYNSQMKKASAKCTTNTIVCYVCGATGKVAGITPYTSRKLQWKCVGMTALTTLMSLAPFVEPALACTAALATGIVTPAFIRQYKVLECKKRQIAEWAQLRRTGLLNFAADSGGYKWTVEDEERAEYEYREEVRQAARRRLAFEEQLREEVRRSEARAERKEKLFNFASRTRHDLLHTDPLGYYAILGLKGKEYSASMKEIADAFRLAVRKHHPDVSRTGDEEGSKQHMQKIIIAYRVLSNSTQRKEYDNSVANNPQSHDNSTNYQPSEPEQQEQEEEEQSNMTGYKKESTDDTPHKTSKQSYYRH